MYLITQVGPTFDISLILIIFLIDVCSSYTNIPPDAKVMSGYDYNAQNNTHLIIIEQECHPIRLFWSFTL